MPGHSPLRREIPFPPETPRNQRHISLCTALIDIPSSALWSAACGFTNHKILNRTATVRSGRPTSGRAPSMCTGSPSDTHEPLATWLVLVSRHSRSPLSGPRRLRAAACRRWTTHAGGSNAFGGAGTHREIGCRVPQCTNRCPQSKRCFLRDWIGRMGHSSHRFWRTTAASSHRRQPEGNPVEPKVADAETGPETGFCELTPGKCSSYQPQPGENRATVICAASALVGSVLIARSKQRMPVLPSSAMIRRDSRAARTDAHQAPGHYFWKLGFRMRCRPGLPHSQFTMGAKQLRELVQAHVVTARRRNSQRPLRALFGGCVRDISCRPRSSHV